jgi:hypothetical protein
MTTYLYPPQAVGHPAVIMNTLLIVTVLLCSSVAGSEKIMASGIEIHSTGKQVTKLSPGGVIEVIYETRKSIGRDPEISPNGEYVSIVETSEWGGNDLSRKIPPRNNLVICDTGGAILCEIGDDVRELSWSPDGERIACLTGSYNEDVGFNPTGIFIYNLTSKDKMPIEIPIANPAIEWCKEPGYQICWARHDSNIYIKRAESCGGNYMYDVKTGQTRQVPYKGIYFSPDGEFYLDVDPENGNFVYETTSNREITDSVLLSLPQIPLHWVPDSTHHLLSGKIDYEDYTANGEKVDPSRVYVSGQLIIKEKRFYLYDVEQRRIVNEWLEKP